VYREGKERAKRGHRGGKERVRRDIPLFALFLISLCPL